jgi:sulfur relay protein TusB/DsrH
MKLGIFFSETESRIVERLKAERVGIFFVQNGVYHPILNDKPPIDAELYLLKEDLETRGFSEDDLRYSVECVDYSGLVDAVFEYEKLIWL